MIAPHVSCRSTCVTLAISIAFIATSHAQNPPQKKADFPGVSELLRQLQSLKSSKEQKAAVLPKDEADELLKDIDAFPSYAVTLPPEKAAHAWLDLFDRYDAILQKPAPPGSDTTRLQSPSVLFDVLPGPSTWPALTHLVETRSGGKDTDPFQTILLSLIVHTLNHQEGAQWADIHALAQAATNSSTSAQFSRHFGDQSLTLSLGQQLSFVASDPVALEEFWNQVIDQKFSSSPQSYGNPSLEQVELPDFLALLGKEKASTLLGKILVSRKIGIQSIRGNGTLGLARTIAAGCVDKIVNPPWCITYSLDSEALYEALEKKFGEPDDTVARSWHIMRLILHNKVDAAATAASGSPNLNLEEPLNQAIAQGAGPQIYDFLQSLLTKNPQTDLWDMYVDVAAQTEQGTNALQFIRDTAAKTDLSPEVRQRVNGVLYKALLANDDIDAGVAGLRHQIEMARSQMDANQKSPTLVPGDSKLQQLVDLDLDLATLGRLLKKGNLESDGLKMAETDLKSYVGKTSADPSGDIIGARGKLIDYYLKAGNESAAAALQIRSIVDQARSVMLAGQQNKSPDFSTILQTFGQDNGSTGSFKDGLVQLATIFYDAQRSDDNIQLFEEIPWWGTSDLLSIAKERVDLYRYSTPTMALVAAKALSERGRLDEARTILNYDLQIDSADDAAYELLLKIGQGDLIGQLQNLFKQDQFEPRPLIWKASLLLQQGKVGEAEQSCKQAISIDPSDGQSGKGDRMRVYSVMADICDAKNDTNQATFYRNVVSAIRISENADDFFDAGLLTRAVAMYQEALGHFSDAYCIQSRMARQLATLGKIDEAALHYRQAFELMPESFGRMESHCFGCEEVFKGKTASDVAEETFKALLTKEPNKPQVHYLMGYLLKEEDRNDEAIPYFQQAATLDPDYINAWKEIVELGTSCRLPNDLQDQAIFNLIRLDPAGRHDFPNMGEVTNLAKLWDVVASSVTSLPPTPSSLMKLTASAKKLEELEDKMKKLDAASWSYFKRQMEAQQSSSSVSKKSPQQFLQENNLIQQCVNALF